MPGLQEKRTWLLGGAVAAVAVSGAGWFFGVSPVLSDTDSLHQQTARVQDDNLSAQRKIADLAKEATRLSTRQQELRAALAALPMDNGLPGFTRQLSRQAAALGVQVRSVDVGSFTAVGAAAGTTTGTTTAATSTTTGATTGATGTTTGATSTTTGTTTTPAGGIVAIQVTVTSDGPAARQVAFLHAVQAVGPRVALVTNVGLTAGTTTNGGATWTMTTALTVFATPKSTADRARIETLLHQK